MPTIMHLWKHSKVMKLWFSHWEISPPNSKTPNRSLMLRLMLESPASFRVNSESKLVPFTSNPAPINILTLNLRFQWLEWPSGQEGSLLHFQGRSRRLSQGESYRGQNRIYRYCHRGVFRVWYALHRSITTQLRVLIDTSQVSRMAFRDSIFLTKRPRFIPRNPTIPRRCQLSPSLW